MSPIPPVSNPAAPASPAARGLHRRGWLAGLLALGGLAGAGRGIAAPAAVEVEVWKSPSCGCCKDWIAHLEKNGFRVRSHDEGNTEARVRLGLPKRYGSCHTARVVAPGGAAYVLEGHVPARELKRLLREQPAAIGLAVPAMPVGSPGMDGPEYGGQRDPYDVLLVQHDGSASVYQAYR